MHVGTDTSELLVSSRVSGSRAQPEVQIYPNDKNEFGLCLSREEVPTMSWRLRVRSTRNKNRHINRIKCNKAPKWGWLMFKRRFPKCGRLRTEPTYLGRSCEFCVAKPLQYVP
jgi:hypothetical protein